MLTLAEAAPVSAIIQNLRPFFVIKTHYNEISAQQICDESRQHGYFKITYQRVTDRLRISKAKPGDMVLVCHSLPIRYQGGACITEVTQVIDSQILHIKFVRFLHRKVDMQELYTVEKSLKSSSRVFIVSEQTFYQLLALENE
ncbi:Conserved_hypothetical protein [Hexamita inflata]|uniref:Uncharacterized protein n=1 Tax=Hexamita inflata TaxID=28002 RepID=A0AA86PJU4_9EUKA|nr:Conserved hypothetical protein [Hexamita inflata]